MVDVMGDGNDLPIEYVRAAAARMAVAAVTYVRLGPNAPTGLSPTKVHAAVELANAVATAVATGEQDPWDVYPLGEAKIAIDHRIAHGWIGCDEDKVWKCAHAMAHCWVDELRRLKRGDRNGSR